MSPLYLHNGQLLLVNGALASNQNCCCGECCIKNINCEVIVTVTYSNGQTKSNADEMLDEGGNPIGGAFIGSAVSISQDCTNTIAFSHYYVSDGNCNQAATKSQKISCNICCSEQIFFSSFYGCDCSLGDIVTENYDFNPLDPGADCSSFNGVYVTDIAFSLANCTTCPCWSCCEYETTENLTVTYSGPEGNFTASGFGPSIGDFNQGLYVAFDCTYFFECDGVTGFPALYVTATIDGNLGNTYQDGIQADIFEWNCDARKTLVGQTFTLQQCFSGATATLTVTAGPA